MLFSRAARWFAVVLLSLCAVSCSTTEPTTIAPHVNPSPEEVVLADGARADADAAPGISIGLEAEVNESDSLDSLEVLPGVRVARLDTSGAAAGAGLKVGDVVLSVDGVTSNDPDALEGLLRQAEDGSRLRLEVRRDTVVFSATVAARALPGAAKPPRELYRIDPIKLRAGFSTDVVTVGGERRTAARIVRFFPASPLPEAGLAIDSRLVSLGERPLKSAQDLVTSVLERHEPGDEVVLGVVRDGEVVPVYVTLWEPDRRLAKLAVLPLFNYETKLAPSETAFSILDFWIVSLFSYRRSEGEREYRFFSLFRFGSGYGELVEEGFEEAGSP